MNRFLLLAAIATIIASPSSAEIKPRVTMSGYGDIRIGMTLSALKARHPKAAILSDLSDDESSCAVVEIPHLPGLRIMLANNDVAVIIIDSPRYSTLSGAYVGMSQTKILALYGPRMKVRNHPYVGPEGKYLVLRAEQESKGAIFETDGQRMTSYRMGDWKEVQYIEGCL